MPNDLKDRRFAISQAKNEVDGLCEFHDYNFRQYKGKQPMNKIARNLVDYEAGKTIFETMLKVMDQESAEQIKLF